MGVTTAVKRREPRRGMGDRSGEGRKMEGGAGRGARGPSAAMIRTRDPFAFADAPPCLVQMNCNELLVA